MCCIILHYILLYSTQRYYYFQGFSQRKKSRVGGGQWEAKNVFVFRRLFLWREKEAEERDESPSYICRGSLLLDAAEFLPITITNLMKLQSPLQSSMRSPLNPLFSDTKTLIENGKMEVNLVQAVIDALSLWENVMRKQTATLYSERNGGIDDNYKEKHNKRINNVEKIDKNTLLPSGKSLLSTSDNTINMETNTIRDTEIKSNIKSDMGTSTSPFPLPLSSTPVSLPVSPPPLVLPSTPIPVSVPVSITVPQPSVETPPTTDVTMTAPHTKKSLEIERKINGQIAIDQTKIISKEKIIKNIEIIEEENEIFVISKDENRNKNGNRNSNSKENVNENQGRNDCGKEDEIGNIDLDKERSDDTLILDDLSTKNRIIAGNNNSAKSNNITMTGSPLGKGLGIGIGVGVLSVIAWGALTYMRNGRK